MANEQVDRVYAARTVAEQEAVYDGWAESYERDLCAMGYRAPHVAAAAFARFVPLDVAPILDAGCGGGLQAEALKLLGYGPIHGFDLSDGMLAVARRKGIYEELRRMALGDGLDYPAGLFGAVISVGTITQGHAPPSSFADLVQVTRPGGRIVLSQRNDAGIDPAYTEARADLEASGKWRNIFVSKEFLAMPYSEPDVTVQALVYEVL